MRASLFAFALLVGVCAASFQAPLVPSMEQQCSGHGVFVDDACVCDASYTGANCEVECSGHGKVDAALGFCVCDDEFAGPNCGYRASCANFEGSWINVDHAHGISMEREGAPFTIELWVRPAHGGVSLLDKHSPVMDKTNYVLVLGGDEEDDTRVGLMNVLPDCDTDWSKVPFTERKLPVDAWSHIAVSYDGCKAHFFVNGEFDSKHEFSVGRPNTGSLYIGRDVTGRWLDGSLEEIRLWSIARTHKAIKRDLHYTLTGMEDGLEAYYRINEGTGNAVKDYTRNRNDGLFYDGEWTASCAPVSYTHDADCPKQCSHHGLCVNGVCMCDPGFVGEYCGKKTCPNDCSMHGECYDGECHCEAGFAGVDCATKLCERNCTGHGVCVQGECSCERGWEGELCELAACFPKNCSGNGVCTEGVCQCAAGFTGSGCGVRLCPNDCSGRGNCTLGVCSCVDGWMGADCSNRSCAACEHGDCANGVCLCRDGYSGDDCSIAPCPADCSGAGLCVAGECHCNAGFSGADCSVEGHDRFELFHATDGQWYFVLVNRYGDKLLSSGGFGDEQQARKGIEYVAVTVLDDSRFERLTKNGLFFSRLLSNEEPALELGFSQLYKTEQESENVIALIKASAPHAPVQVVEPRKADVSPDAKGDDAGDAAGSAVAMGEVGRVEVGGTPKVVKFTGTYTHPVVITGAASAAASTPAVPRVTRVESDAFEIVLQAPPALTATPDVETVPYVVMEAGVWKLVNGGVVEVGTVRTNKTVGAAISPTVFETVHFDAVFDRKPVLVSAVQSNAASHYVYTRQAAVATPMEARVALEQDAVESEPHAAEEVVGYVALEAAHASWSKGGMTYEAATTDAEVTHAVAPAGFKTCFADAPVFIGTLGTRNNDINAHLRVPRVDKCGVSARVEGDEAKVEFAGEAVNYLAFAKEGVLRAIAKSH